ncbi:hypothetical protein FQN60_016202 [Etheostoma spectabile]|uniref:Uncharacterized protein n=1 Tax=Etheostoma spectabile TaxID=54343 RepID=A0A5J5D377_9PERO|nr:hypothetical protein FQN60_016202 [Etheostoma spectabile]
MGLSVKCIAKLVGVSRWTLQRRMNKWGLSVRGLYSDLTDDELDILVSAIRASNPNAGYRMMMDCCEHRDIVYSGRGFVHQCTELTL